MSLRVAILGQLPGALLAQLAEMASSLDLVVLGQAPDSRTAQVALTSPLPDLAVVSTTFADGSGVAFLRGLSASQRPAAVVLVGGREEEAVTAFELQATDFVLWPADSDRLKDAVTRAKQQVLQQALLRTADELQRLLSEAGTAGGIDLAGLFRARTAPLVTAAPTSSNGHGAYSGAGAAAIAVDVAHVSDARRRRLGGGKGATGTLVVSSPWRNAGRLAELRSREGADEGVLDLSQEDGGRSAGDARPLRVLVREGRRTRFVPLADVDWFEADGNYIRVHAAGETFRTRGTISAIEASLDPRQFVRIHRRIVVNMDRVREMSPLPGGDGLLVLGDGSTLRLSRTYRSRVR